MTITVIGAGYVGLVTSTIFADLGNKVNVIDVIPEKVDSLKKGIVPFYEPGLSEMVKRNLKAGRLNFGLSYDPVGQSDVVFIAVGTPSKANGEAELAYVFEAAEKIAKNLKDYTVVITKSTIPVGTGRKVKAVIEKNKHKDAEFDYASVPEFLREGQAISDTLHPDRAVIGTENKQAEKVLTELHMPILQEGAGKSPQLVLTTIETAEMIKYASNAFLATKISFANAIAQLSELTGADGLKVLKAMGDDKRIGKSFLNPGAGYGGSCFPKDVQALIAISGSYGFDFGLLREVEDINKNAIKGIVDKARKMLKKTEGKTVGMLGLAFKPDTDDMRDAPAISIINELLSAGVKIKAYDPIAINNARRIFGEKIKFVKDSYEAADRADLLIIITEWNEFRQLNLKKIKDRMKSAKIIDGRNIYDAVKVKRLGFEYMGVGVV